MIKTCERCGSTFEGHFNRHYCDECRLAKNREHALRQYYKHKDECLARNKAWCLANPDKRKESKRRQYQRHRDSILAKSKQYRADNRDKRLAYERRYRQINRELLCIKDQLRNPRRAIIRKLKLIDEGRRVKPFCHSCGKMFTPTYQGEKYCSDRCRRLSPLWRVWLRSQSRFGY